jgi:hypothetical protein
VDQSEQEQRLMSVLDRQVACNSLDALISALKPERSTIPLSATAIGLDATAFLRIAGHRKGADIVDYLSSTHSAPLVLPGQAIQEFWNNQLQVVYTVAATLRKQFNTFKESLEKVDRAFGEELAQVGQLLTQFSAEHGHVYDEATVRNTVKLLEDLSRRAIIPYAPRLRYAALAATRKATKTPPGFRDEGDGDFFVWVDLLTGLQKAQTQENQFSRVVLVSLDKKVDWSRAGTAHPILVAEVQTLLAVPFEIWTIDRLSEEIAIATEGSAS